LKLIVSADAQRNSAISLRLFEGKLVTLREWNRFGEFSRRFVAARFDVRA